MFNLSCYKHLLIVLHRGEGVLMEGTFLKKSVHVIQDSGGKKVSAGGGCGLSYVCCMDYIAGGSEHKSRSVSQVMHA